MVLKVHRNRQAYEGRGEVGKGVWSWDDDDDDDDDDEVELHVLGCPLT